MRNLFIVGIVGSLVGLSSDAAFALDPGACCAAQTSKVDNLMNPVVGGDEKFFSATGSPTTVMFLVGTYLSMRDFLVPLPNTASGCTNATDVAGFLAIYDKNDPLKQGLTPVDADPTLGARFFDPARFYTAERTRLKESGTGASFSTGDFTTVASHADANSVCSSMGLTAAEVTTCTACVDTATGPGWYRKDNARYALKGGVLNMNPPKFVTTRAVVKEVAGSLSNVRIGFAAFNAGSGDYYDPPRIPVRASPACNALNPIDSAAVLSSVRTAINSLAFTGSERQIGEALFGIGAYFSRKAQWKTWFDNIPVVNNYPGSGGWNNGTTMWTEDITNPKIWGAGEEMCSECQQTMVIVLTDGTPDADNSVPVTKMMSLLIGQSAQRPDGTPLTFSPNVGGVCPNPTATGGINFCDRFSSTKCACDYVSSPQGPDNGNKNFMDDVAFFLANQDLRPEAAMPGKQTVKTYTIGLGDNSPMLQSIAFAGGGQFYTANNAIQLKSAVIAAIQDLQSKTTGFSGASVAAVQQAGGSEAILPRLLPRSDKPWIGSLWRFELYNEFIEGVSITDGGLNNVLMTDDAGVEVVEDLTLGRFVKKGTPTAADPFWEAGDRLVALGHANRSLWTVQDSDLDGAFTSNDTLLEFTLANRATLTQYLGVIDTPFCPTLAGPNGKFLNKLGLNATQLASAINAIAPATVVAAPVTQVQLNDICVAGLILYQRGADLADEDGDGNRSETRRSVLADIFHSTPVSVVPPVDTFLCDLGIVNQCTRTLYSQALSVTPTTLATHATEVDCANATQSRTAYDAWQYRGRKREKAVLVGTNDGVLHAFHNGAASETCTGGNSKVTYNQGTGREIWAFIPPDQLSRLQEQMDGHTYGVDGDVMVRDIWADGSGSLVGGVDGIKQRDEYHTVAIAAEGRGGTHYFAVEILFNTSGNDQTTIRDRPKFLWMFPQPCSSEAQLFGKTFNTISPKPPPIGPVLIANSSSTYNRYGTTTDETWVAMLSGGWSPGREKGRGVYMVDAYRGQVNTRRDNLLWKFEFIDNASGDLTPLKKLGQSVAAPVAMVDYGENADPRQDGFFDTAVFGDIQGQLWVTRFQKPGTIDATTKLVNNWRGGRAFEMDSDTAPADPADGDPEPDDADKKSNLNKQPFYYLPAIAQDPATNELRAFIGTGERYSVLDAPMPICRFDNPVACAKAQCNDVKVRYRLDSPKVDINRLETNFKKRQFAKGKADWSPQTDAACGSNNLHAWFEEYRVNACRLTDATDRNPGRLNDADVRCTQNATATSYSCNYTAAPTIITNDLLPANISDVAGIGLNRYFGLLVYGGSRVFNEGDGTATTFDSARLTDRPAGGSLVNVTSTTCTGPGLCTGPTANNAGWFIDYDVQATKTATGSAIASSCVLWNTLTPANGGGSSCAAGAGNPTARLVQANVFTGAPDCAEGFLDGGVSQRSIARSVVAPPPEPSTSIQLSKTGQVQTTALVIEPGQTTSVNVTTGQDVLQLVYELPVSRALHNCRHSDAGCTTTP